MKPKMYKKWNNYTIGKIPFVNKNYDHPHRKVFIDYVLKEANSVIEFGPGELIEYQQIDKQKKVKYCIVDVSDLFIKNCKQKYPQIQIIQSSMENIGDVEKSDVAYAASVLEHSKDVRLALKNMIKCAISFHFVMFKWSYGGTLNSEYNSKKKYWSSSFNIYVLLEEISKFGTIEHKRVACKNGSIVEFEEYSKGLSGPHRNGDYLIIQGKAK